MTNIEWCDETINPLGWGCYGPKGTAEKPRPCSYCYARKWARGVGGSRRKCPECAAFIPHWHPEMLQKPFDWKKPRRIFVQSMGDLFHPETPAEHIKAVLVVAECCPQHTFIFLTKSPLRYQEFDFPGNCLLGATATSQFQWDMAVDYFSAWSGRDFYFISAEPLLGPITPDHIDVLDWLIIGANSNRGAEKPRCKWGDDLIEAARVSGVPVFVKNNWPWLRYSTVWSADEWPPQQFPEAINGKS